MPTHLDHIVINTRFEMDSAAHLFEALGFQLTPRGHHPTLGSINHLMVFERGYLELIGLQKGAAKVRQELIDSPVGLNGLVLTSDDPEATRDEMLRAGFEAQPVQHFSRPLTIDGQDKEARFSTVRLALDSFAAGRVYFCQHHTPELVWRREWMDHPNGVTGISELIVASDDPAATEKSFDRLGDIGGDFKLSVMDNAALKDRFGKLASIGADRPERFAALTMQSREPEIMARRAQALGLPCHSAAGRAVVALPEFSSLIEVIV